MANSTPITITRSPEAPGYTPTAISSGFAGLLVNLAEHIEAERDIENASVWDIAFDNWLRHAEKARTDMSNLLTSILREDIVRLEDKPLKRMAMLINGVVVSEEPGAYRYLRPFVSRFDNLFRCVGQDPTSLRVDRMLLTARDRLETMYTLEIYAPVKTSSTPQVTEDENEELLSGHCPG